MSHPTPAVAVPVQIQQKAAPASASLSGLLQRKCACGQHTIVGGECEECRRKRAGTLQRAAINTAPTHGVPPIVHDVLNSPGQPLDAGTRAFMEPRFGQDFSQVRVHTGSRAAESAQAVNALAYTVGRNVVFGTGQYAPGTNEGGRLLAHELTHVVQQDRGSHLGTSVSATLAENEADQASIRLVEGQPTAVHTSVKHSIQRQFVGQEEIRRRIAEIERLVSSGSLPAEELLRLQVERNSLSAQLQGQVGGTIPTLGQVGSLSLPGALPLTVPLNVTYVANIPTGRSPGPILLPGILGAAGRGTLGFLEPLGGIDIPPGALTRYVGPESLEGFLDLSRFGLTRELAPRLLNEPWTPAIEAAWLRQGVTRAQLINLSQRLQTRGFDALMAENDPILNIVTRAHAEEGLVQGSPLLSLTELAPGEGQLPPVATGRAYIVRVLVDPEDVGRVNEILGRTQDASRLAQEIEVVVAQDLAGEARIVSIIPNPSGALGGGLGTALRWTGHGFAIIGAGLAIYDIATAEGPHRRETEGRAFGSFAGGTVLGGLGVGFCVGAGIATGGLGLLLCGLVAGGAGALGGQALGGTVGRQFD
jgi:hypothetical protein